MAAGSDPTGGDKQQQKAIAVCEVADLSAGLKNLVIIGTENTTWAPKKVAFWKGNPSKVSGKSIRNLGWSRRMSLHQIRSPNAKALSPQQTDGNNMMFV